MEEITNEIIAYIAMLENIDTSELNGQTDLTKDAGMSSLDIVQMLCSFEEKYDLVFDDIVGMEINTIADVAEYMNTKPKNWVKE
jgi:NADH dehydrogenase (ubiquinone) 1 alpha/beta subcomplex 1